MIFVLKRFAEPLKENDMMKICFATNNQSKIKEVRAALEGKAEIIGLADIGCTDELPETRDTIEGNSAQKAEYVWEHFHTDSFSDDSGLEVEALNGAPGVDSAHYAGPQRNNKDNIDKLLEDLKGETNRKARFKTCITLIESGKATQFIGLVQGIILEAPSGTDGFGYDPVFLPDGHTLTFAQMSVSEKNKISHRGLAVGQLVEYLQKKTR